MFPTVRSHLEYQDFVTQQLKTYYVGGILSLQNSDWILIEKLWLVDLSRTFSLLKDTFSSQGPCPHDPADLLRSYILMHLTGTFSVTKWVTALRRIPLFAVLSGFLPGKTPGIGTFYDFCTRLWLTDNLNFRSKLKRKPKKLRRANIKAIRLLQLLQVKWRRWLKALITLLPVKRCSLSTAFLLCLKNFLFCILLALVSWAMLIRFAWLVTVPRYELLLILVINEYATVNKMVFLTVIARESILNLTAILAGIVTVKLILMATISTLFPLLPVSMICPYIVVYTQLPAMILYPCF